MMSDPPRPFEEALTELQSIVERLEAGDLTLEEMLTLFERGQELAALCNKVLDEAELRLEQLRSTSDGGYVAERLKRPEE